MNGETAGPAAPAPAGTGRGGAGLGAADRLAALSPEQRALFETLRRRRQETARLLEPPPIPRVTPPSGEGDWPLSFDQERFWFMEQLYPGRAGLNITAATRMRGRLSAAVLAAALGRIVGRHAAWRTTFPTAGGSPLQRVAAARRQRLALVDLGGLPRARREPEALRLVGGDVAAPFDLARGPLLRASLLRLAGEDHVCLLTVHHLVADWISFQIAWAELAALYEALAAGREPALPAPPVQYPDFALWQRRWLTGEVLAALVSWWRGQLAGVPPALELATDRPRPAAPRQRGGRRSFTVPREVASALAALARQEGATLFMAVLAATGALLHRDSGQERLILGANNANRNRPEIEPVVGCFLTTVPFVVDLAGDPPWRELLARVRRSALGALAHQDLPFGRLVEAIQPARDTSRQPLVQALVQVLDGQYSKTGMAGLALEPLDAWDGRARYDLMLSMVDFPAGLAAAFDYDADLFDPATAARMAGRLELQLAAALADPGRPLSTLPVLTAAERHQAAVEWNDSACPPPAWTVPERVAAQAARTPHAVAATAGGHALSYGELERRAGALARRLRAAGAGGAGGGAGGETRIALLLDRTLDVPVAILAAWKAGAAYVPLDPGAPPRRLGELLADAAPALLVHRGPLPSGLDAGVPRLDLAVPAAAQDEDGAPLPGSRPADLAYLIYTSGTTGVPKAVMVEHRSLAAFFATVLDRYRLGPGDVVPHLTRYTFDASLEELFAPLLAGATLEIVSAEEVVDPEALLAACERWTRLLVGQPALLRRLAAPARQRGAARFAGLRTIAAGGERVPPDLEQELLAAFPAADLDVLYGPTEATLVCVGRRVERGRRSGRALIGRPLPGVEALVMDPRLPGGTLVHPGVPGELWIGGPGVARGYFRRAELTAERFVVWGGRRFYRTGDMVRQVHAEGGALEFLGRTDHQVKVRGFRIEPGEVEAALAAHPAVREAVVVARPDGSGENRLVAYCVPAAGAGNGAGDGAGDGGEAACGASELYPFLAARLPAYMIPAAFVVLPVLPLTAHGKVDRERLPAPVAGGGAGNGAAGSAAEAGAGDPNAPEAGAGTGAGDRDAPGAGAGTEAGARAAPLEEMVAGTWCDVLGLRAVARHANFFELGGHSLLATQVVSRLRAATGAELPVRAIFHAPTVAALAAALAAALDAGTAAAAAPPIRRRARDRELPLSFAQERLWFLDRLAPGSAAYNVPLALAARGRLSLPALAAALDEVTRRHEVLRTSYQEDTGQPAEPAMAPAETAGPPRQAQPMHQLRQVIAPPCRRALPLADLSRLPPARREAAARRAAAAEVVRPFDLARGPVLRALALRLEAARDETGRAAGEPPRPGAGERCGPGGGEHVLLLVVHHIAADGWSVGVMVREIGALYAAALAGRPSPLPELAIQYADFALWQREWLQGDVLALQLAYWRERLADAPPLVLPADRPRPPAPSLRGLTRRHDAGRRAAAAVRELARRTDSTLFMVLLAAVQIVLGRYAGQDDVVLGSPIANRTRAEIEPLIGFFVNSLALRGDLAGDPPFREAVARARRAALDAYAHQDLPFERLVEELRPERRLAHNPLFQVMFAVQNAPLGAVDLPGVALAPVDLDFPAATRFDVELHCFEAAGSLAFQLTAGADLYDPPTALRLLGHLETLLAAATADPELPLSALPLLPAGERHQLLAEWNDTAAGPADAAVATLFFAQARCRPEAVALAWEDGQMTYGELGRRAARLACRLAAAGVGPEVRVALLAQRSPAMIVALLAILAAGGAYVPLDPAYPAARLAFMLADSGARVLLGDRELLAELPAGLLARAAGGGPLDILDLAAALAEAPGDADAASAAGGWAAGREAPDAPGWRPAPLPPDALAYLMYTSGSTGRPRGVGAPHRGIVRLVRAGGFADLGEREVFLQLAPISFDASTLEIWGPLLNGGRLALFPPRRPALEELGDTLARWGVTTLWLTAGLFHALVEERPGALAPLRQLLAGGDVLSPPQVRRALAAHPRLTLINGYGPTEVTTFTCCHAMTGPAAVGSPVPAAGARRRVMADPPILASGTSRRVTADPPILASGTCRRATADPPILASGTCRRVIADPPILASGTCRRVMADPPISIGRPIGNTRVHVLGPDLAPLPAGVWGELWAGGDGLARGYLGQPGWTAERFLPDPNAGVLAAPGARLYRTGDRARFLPDGRIELAGRLDAQVKVRGFRVEPAEVERVLARHPRVGAAAVAVRDDGSPAGKRLIAYVVPRPASNAAADAAAPREGMGSESAASATMPGGATGEKASGEARSDMMPGEARSETMPGEARQRVEQWRQLYDQTYGKGLATAAAGDAGFNVQGWNSSETGEPIPAAEMREWLEGTVGRLLPLPRRRVLEVGCGTGLLLLRLAPGAERYRGTDFSAAALAQLGAEVGRRGLGQVELAPAEADDWSGVPAGEYDLVILNSVVQYFPGAEYLARVLAGALAALAPGGTLFVGDVRSLPLLAAFHASVELARAAGSLPAAELARRVRRRIADEEELLVDPALFHALAARSPSVREIEIQLRRGRHANELTRFRYDAILRTGEPPAAGAVSPACLRWQDDRLTLAELERRLAAPAGCPSPCPASLAVAGIPNARLAAAAAAVELLAGPGPEMETVAELRAELQRRLAGLDVDPSTRPVDPETLWELAERLGYEAVLTWSRAGGAEARMDAHFRPRAAAAAAGAPAPLPATQGSGEEGASCDASAQSARSAGSAWASLAAWTNDPLRAGAERRLIPELRRFLDAELPDYMMPAAFVLLDALPLTPNGKVDRRALPAPEGPGEPAAGWVAPASPLEELLAATAAELLGTERVGLRDNFFALGGHSLLATQLVSRLVQDHALPVTLEMVFDAADLGDLADRIVEREPASAGAGLSRGERAQLFEQARRRRQPVAAAAGRIPRRAAASDPPPASFAQERLWFMDRLAPGNPAYNIPLALRIAGAAAPALLAAVLGEVVRRHEALRTTFRERDGQPIQVIAPPPPGGWKLPLVELSALPPGSRGAAALRLARQDAAGSFQLDRGPLLRAALLRLGPVEHVLLLNLHHVISDGWSMGVLVREITALYGSAVAPRPQPPPLPALPIQYADFAVWQREWLAGENLERQVAYWRQRLAGAPAALALPADRQRPANPTWRGARLRTRLDAGFTGRLRRLARRGEASLYMALLAGFQALLGRLTGQEDLVVGSPIANRNRAEIEPLIGFFVNTLAMRGELAGDPSFGELLGRVRRGALAAFAHQDLPFERLVEELRPERHLALAPLFQVVCALQNAPVGRIDLPGLALAPLEVEATTAQFDLELNVWEDEGDTLLAVLAYSSELFDAPTACRLAGHFEVLLRAAMAEPQRPLSQLPLLAAAARHQLLVEWNDAPRLPRPAVLARFAEQAARRPEAPAVAVAGAAAAGAHGGVVAAAGAPGGAAAPRRPQAAPRWVALDYSQLDRLSELLAHRLRACGVRPGVVVGVCLERSPALVVGLLGVWKAGGIYLPLDPAYPESRLSFLLGDSEAAVLLSEERLRRLLPPHRGPALFLDAEAAGAEPAGTGPGGTGPGGTEPAGAPVAPPPTAATWGDSAYLMYTSGTSGRPKGVMVSHDNLAATLAATRHLLAFDEGDRMPALAPISFDISLFEILSPLLAGGTLVLWPPGPSLDVERLAAELPDWTRLHAVPALMAQIMAAVRRGNGGDGPIESGSGRDLRGLRTLLVGGDVVPDTLLEEMRQAVPHAETWVLYGPTEATILCAAWRVPRDPAQPARTRLGRPLPGALLTLRDGHGQPVPPGAPGEIWIGGAGVARGYWRREALTAERFVAPGDGDGGFGGTGAAGRHFRTGDLARQLSDGTLEFLGRVDRQVKVRGFRIEPGEVEGVLARHPEVASAVVEARAEEAGGGKRLVAYVVRRRAAGPSGDGWEDEAAAARVATWRRLYDEVYGPAAPGPEMPESPPGQEPADPLFDLRGWDSSFTGKPIPGEEMREWVETTVERIRALGGRRVLEVGCGTGLLLYRLAPGAQRYRGTDLSARALAGIRRQLGRSGLGLGHVELVEAAADDWSGVEPGAFDLVVLNSVSQYFPSARYLVRVLAAAIRAVAPGGAVFVGDVRSRPLQEAFAAAVELARAPGSRTAEDLSRRIWRRVAAEEELMLDPALFLALAGRLPGVSRVGLLRKRGRSHNEMTCFRYDVVLRAAGEQEQGGASAGHGSTAPSPPSLPPPPSPLPAPTIHGVALDRLAIATPAIRAEIERLLGRRGEAAGGGTAEPSVLRLTGLLDARLGTAAAALALVAGGEGEERTAAELRRAAAVAIAGTAGATGANGAVDPEELWRLADRLGWDAEIMVEPLSPFRFGAALRRRDASGSPRAAPDLALLGAAPAAGVFSAGTAHAAAEPPWETFANDPLRGEARRRLAPRLRRHLAAELPDYMVPSAFVFLDRLPLTAHGKVDRAALPEPEVSGGLGDGGTRPRTALEVRLAVLWQEVLGVERVALEDNFFELGGHSLLATQLVSRLRAALGIDVPLRRVFERPVLADLASGLAAELDSAAGGLAGAAAGAGRPAPARPRRREAPLSFAQEMCWAMAHDGSTAFSIPSPLRLLGPLDPRYLERAFQELFGRHDALRTRFAERRGEPLQVIDSPRPFALPRLDLAALPEERRRREAESLVDADVGRPFDLARGPLVRVALARLTAREHVLMLNGHHLVLDGWSMGVLVAELVALYQAAATGLPSPLPAPPAQLADLAVAQRERLAGGGLEERLAYWRRAMAGAPPLLALPLDRPRPAVPSHRGDLLPGLLPPDLVERLAELGGAAGASLYMIILAGLAVVLGRASGQDDIVVGSPVAGREDQESERVVGMLLNMVPMRVGLAGRPTFRELLERVRRTALAAFAHQEVSLEQLIDALGVERHPSYHPLFQVTLNMLNFPGSGAELPGGLAVELIPPRRIEAKYDFTFYVFAVPEGLRLNLVYSTDLFERPRMEALLADLTALLRQAAADAELPIA